MNVVFPNLGFSDEEWLYILERYLKGWTEIPLSNSYGYDVEALKFYDGFIGTLLKRTEQVNVDYPHCLDGRFVNSWKYQGKLYRVMHSHYVFDNGETEEPRLVMPQVNYHGMISHWTDDYTFAGLQYKLNPDAEYIILEADTGDHFAFDVNGFRKEYGCEEQFTEKEREFIFPMYKECIKEYRMTITEFAEMKKREVAK